MKMSEAFPGKYLKAADLQGREATKRIAYCEKEKVGQNGDIKPVLHFTGEHQGLVLNKTNACSLSAAYGDDSESWRGREIVLYPATVDFAGKPTPTIRVRAAGGAPAFDSFNDTIPF